jgi:hypothetical protein
MQAGHLFRNFSGREPVADDLIATEGTTDSRILKFAFNALRPAIADFFRFVDVDERHNAASV